MRAVKLYFQSPEGKLYRMSFEIDQGLDEVSRILELTMNMLEKKHGCFDMEPRDIHVISEQTNIDDTCRKIAAMTIQ